MRFCCGVTLFYPSEMELESIKKYKDIFGHIYVFDNTENPDIIKRNKVYFEKDQFMFISKNKNEGLSSAFNIMCKQAINNGFDYICLFDQDSVMPKQHLDSLINFIENDPDNTIGVYAPEIIYQHKSKTTKTVGNINGFEIDWEITSGSFINLRIYQKTEGFDENYFIDRLDYDYCYSIRELGYKVIQVREVFLYQALGEQGKGLLRKVSQHTPIRHYYIFRNRLYFYLKKRKISILEIIKVILLSMNQIISVLFLENNKIEKIKMMAIGAGDFIRNNMGKYGPI